MFAPLDLISCVSFLSHVSWKQNLPVSSAESLFCHEISFFFFYPVLRRPTPQSMFDLNVLGSTTHKVHGLPTPHKLYGAQLWFYLGSA